MQKMHEAGPCLHASPHRAAIRVATGRNALPGIFPTCDALPCRHAKTTSPCRKSFPPVAGFSCFRGVNPADFGQLRGQDVMNP